MPEQAAVDPVRALVDHHARNCLSDLVICGAAPAPDAIVLTKGEWTILMATYRTPTERSIPSLTRCDRDCLALLAEQEEALSAYQLWEELKSRKDTGCWAKITVKRSLVRLKKHGLVCHTRKGPRGSRGYRLPQALRLLDRQDSA